jgi:hypothetical protein
MAGFFDALRPPLQPESSLNNAVLWPADRTSERPGEGRARAGGTYSRSRPPPDIHGYPVVGHARTNHAHGPSPPS